MTQHRSPVIVDAHMHLFTHLSDEYPRGVHDLYPPERTAEVEEYVQYAEECGVAHSVLVSLDEYDEYVIHAVEQYPGRFSAVAVMDTSAPVPVEDLRRRLDKVPLVGFRVWTLGADEQLQVPDTFRDLLAELERSGVAAWFYSDEHQLRALASVVGDYPNLTVVLNHLGFCQSGFACDEWGRPRLQADIPPSSLEIVEDLAQHSNVVALFSGHYAFSREEFPYSDLQVVSQRLLDAFGPERLMWASDWPWIKEQPGYCELLELVSHHLPGLNSTDVDLIVGGNAQRVLGINGITRDRGE